MTTQPSTVQMQKQREHELHPSAVGHPGYRQRSQQAGGGGKQQVGEAVAHLIGQNQRLTAEADQIRHRGHQRDRHRRHAGTGGDDEAGERSGPGRSRCSGRSAGREFTAMATELEMVSMIMASSRTMMMPLAKPTVSALPASALGACRKGGGDFAGRKAGQETADHAHDEEEGGHFLKIPLID